MLLANCVCTSSIEPLGFVAVGCLQRAKYSDIAGLELVGSVRWETAQTNIIFKEKLEDFERLVRPEPVTNQNTRFLTRPLFGLRIENTRKSLQTDIRICVSRIGACEMPPRS